MAPSQVAASLRVWLLLVTTSLAFTDTTLGIAGSCVKGSSVTALPICDSFVNVTNVCGHLAQAERQQCMCNQGYFDSIFNCQNELVSCLEDDVDPVDYASIGAIATRWHNLCDPIVTAQPTTPRIESASARGDADFCFDTVNPLCKSANIMLSQCTRGISSDFAAASSCYCQPMLLSYAYSCQFIGNTSCISVPATLSEVWGYSECSNFDKVIGTGLSNPTLTRVLPSAASTSLGVSAASPGSTQSSASQASPTSSSSSCGRENILTAGLILGTSFSAGLMLAVLFNDVYL